MDRSLWLTLGSFDLKQPSQQQTVMWVIQYSTVHGVYFNSHTLQETLKIRKQHQRESCASVEIQHSFPSVGCASHEWILTITSSGKHDSTLSIGFVPNLWLCWRPWRLLINIKGNILCLWKSNIRSNKLGVQEANVSVSQFHRIGSCFVGCGVCEWMVSLLLIYGMVWSKNYIPRIEGKICCTKTSSSQCEARSYIVENNEAVIKIIIKGRCATMRHVVQNPQWYAWLVVWQNQFGHLNLNQIRWYQKATRRHVDERQFHSWLVESSSPFVQHHDLLDVLLQSFQSNERPFKPCRRGYCRKKKTRRRRMCIHEVQNLWRAHCQRLSIRLQSHWVRVHFTAQRRSKHKIRIRTSLARWDPWREISMKTQHRVLKCDIQMWRRTLVRGDPWREW